MTKTNVLLTLMSIFLFCSCKQIAETSIERSVDNLNKRCPVRLGKVDVLKKVEYRNCAICFYVTEEENDIEITSLTPEQKEKTENNLEFKKQAIVMCVTNNVVNEELGNITDTMADEVNLSFRVFIKGATSGGILKTEFSWKEIQGLESDTSNW